MNTFTLKDLLQVTDLGCMVSVEECDPEFKYGRLYDTDTPDYLLQDLPENLLNCKVFAVDYHIIRCNKVELRYSIVNKEYVI